MLIPTPLLPSPAVADSSDSFPLSVRLEHPVVSHGSRLIGSLGVVLRATPRVIPTVPRSGFGPSCCTHPCLRVAAASPSPFLGRCRPPL